MCTGLSSCTGKAQQTDLSDTDITEIQTTTYASETTMETTETTTTATEETTTAPIPDNLSPEWVRNLDEAQDDSVDQILVVAATGMDETTAYVSMHMRDENGYWTEIISTPGYVGKKGMIADEDRYEGCGRTPIGRYHFTMAFGIAPDPGCSMPYTEVTDDLYWSSDATEGGHYNEMVSIYDYPDLDCSNSEHLIDYPVHYKYCLNISFNEEHTLGRGSAIFLHCNGSNPYTAGCVAVPEDKMVDILQNVEAECVVIIDTVDSLGADY